MNSEPRSRRKRRGSRYKNSRADKTKTEDDYQPTILRKPEVEILDSSINENDEKKKVPEVVPKKPEPPAMKHSVVLITKSHFEPILLSKYLNQENSNFYVVGVIGMKDSGKSTLLNLIATGELHRCEVNGKSKIQAPLFNRFPYGNGVEAFITESRVILLDTAPILHNTNSREFIISEADDIRQVQAMFRMCNLLIIVFESHQILNLIRMVICAKNMMKPYECDEPEITLVENRVQPGSARNPISDVAKGLLSHNNVSDSDSITSISVPDFDHLAPHHNDPLESINQLRDEINTRKELKTYEDPSETEKSWWEKVSKMTMDGGHFLASFEALREKYYQPNENLVFSHNS